MALSALAGCSGQKPAESTPESTPVVTPSETPANTPSETPTETPSETPSETPAETPSETPSETPVETPAETQPLVSYNISYDLDGGYDGGNPTTYNKDSEFTLAIPVKVGYNFAGWIGTGLEAATKLVTVKKGTEGDLSFKATWVENTVELGNSSLDDTYFGADDGLTANPEKLPISTHDKLGGRGEGIFYLKTAYTTVTMDGVMDAAYTYGLHFESDILSDKNFYQNREPAKFDVYVIRSQDGYINIFIEVIDPEIVVNEYIFKTLNYSWHCDSIDFYYEYDNLGSGTNSYNFIADATGKFKKAMPAGTVIKMTEKGYVIETRMDNDGVPFNENDEMGFSFFLNETRDWNEADKTYVKNLLKNHSVKNPANTSYKGPAADIQDAFRISLESATGKVDINADTPAKTGDMLTDIINGSATVLIVYDEYATAQTIISGKSLRNVIISLGGSVKLSIESNVPEDEKFDYTIYLGKTKSAESIALINSLAYNEYGVAIGEDSITAIGWNQDAAYAAYDIIVELFDHVIAGGKTSDFGELYSSELTAVMYDPALRFDSFDGITDVGENAYLIYKLVSNMDEYDAYCAQLEKGGYTLYTTNLIAEKVHFATYYNDDTVVNVQFANGGNRTMQNLNPDNSLRIVVEPLANTALPSLEKPEDADAKVTVSSITQMYPHNLCLVLQLSNGHFIVIDSGNNGTQKVLSDFLRAKAPDGKPIVDAWIMTHFHQDHIGGFVDYMGVNSLKRYITIKSVIYNFPQWQVLETASSTDLNNLRLWYEKRLPAMKEDGTVFYQARTGQKYYFGNAEIEILWSFEDIMPLNVFIDSTNRTDIGFSITIEGQKIMVTGDSTEEEFRVAASKYGKYLKSDMVQLAHHGGGNGMGTHDFYKHVNAPVVFHPNPKTSPYPNPGANERWAINNAQLVIRSGNYGIATLKLPFTVGDKIESTITPNAETSNSVTK